MKYYASKLFTFVEEKTNILTIIDSGNGFDSLECKCAYCESSKPFEKDYVPNPISERNHFFTKIIELHSQTSSLSTVKEKNQHYKEYLEDAQRRGAEIKKESGGVISSETIPSYETRISLIDN